MVRVASVGIALPLLIVADLIAYPVFRKHGSWRPVWKLLPATCAGLALGWLLLGTINDEIARRVIGACVLLMVSVQALRRWKPETFLRIAGSAGFGIGTGLMGGSASMLANAAGPLIQLYLLAKGIPKMEMIGIGARFFLLLNLIKVPLSASLSLITEVSLKENLLLFPAVIVGIILGRILIGRVPQVAFEWMIIGFSCVAAARLLAAW